MYAMSAKTGQVPFQDCRIITARHQTPTNDPCQTYSQDMGGDVKDSVYMMMEFQEEDSQLFVVVLPITIITSA